MFRVTLRFPLSIRKFHFVCLRIFGQQNYIYGGGRADSELEVRVVLGRFGNWEGSVVVWVTTGHLWGSEWEGKGVTEGKEQGSSQSLGCIRVDGRDLGKYLQSFEELAAAHIYHWPPLREGKSAVGMTQCDGLPTLSQHI